MSNRATVLLAIFLQHFYTALAYEEICSVGSAEVRKPLQVAFAVDRTFGVNQRNQHTNQEATTVKTFMAAINRTFPGSEFALTLFSDYPDYLDPRKISGPNDCFTRLTNFSKATGPLVSAVDRFQPIHNMNEYRGYKEGTLFGVMMTAADLVIGWDPKEIVRKVIVFVTNADVSYLGKPGNLQPPKGDGTDTCTNSLPPDYQILQRVLNKKDIITIGALFPYNFNNITDIYQDHFDHIYTPYKGFEVPVFDDKKVTDKLKKAAEDAVEFISTQIQFCVYSDPPAYNTLGL